MSTPRLALLGALLLPPTALAGSGGALVVRATNFRNTDGQAIVEIYNAKDTWLDQGAGLVRRVVPLSGDTLELRFEGLPPGTYAVSVIHDENKNGELDFQWLPPGPAEGSGVSNDAPASFGPPSFADSAFRHSAAKPFPASW